jgi:hypothetical protein
VSPRKTDRGELRGRLAQFAPSAPPATPDRIRSAPREPRVFPPSLLASDSKIILTRYGSVPLRSFLVFASVLMPFVFSFFGEKCTVLASQCLLFVDAFFVACKWRSSLVQVKSFQTGSVLFWWPLEHECAACFFGFFSSGQFGCTPCFNVVDHEYHDVSWL